MSNPHETTSSATSDRALQPGAGHSRPVDSHEGDRAPGPDIVGLGVSALDLVTLVDRFPAHEGVQRAHDMIFAGGGPVATACAAATRLGARTAIMDVVGDDWVGREIVRGLTDSGVDITGIQVVVGGLSPKASVFVERASAARAIAFHPGSIPLRELDERDRCLIESCRFLHVNGRHWPTCLEAAQIARAAGVGVSFDGGAGRYAEAHRALIALADVCVVASAFARALTDEVEPVAQVRAMQNLTDGIVGVTDGERGSWLADACSAPHHQPAYRPPVVIDTTGCGDAYHGALLFALLRGSDLPSAASVASAVAALAAGALGGRAGLPSWAEASSFLADAESLP